MTAFIIQTGLLLLIAFIVGCILGSLLKRAFGTANEEVRPSEPLAMATASRQPVRTAPAEPVSAPPAPVNTLATAEAVPPEKTAAEPVMAPAAAIAPVAPEAPEPKPDRKRTTASAPAAASAGTRDDLKRIRGIGRQNEARLNAEGITSFSQVAAWSAADQQAWGERLAFPGRIEREDWVSQAAILAKGGETGFSRRVDRGEVETSGGGQPSAIPEVGKKPPVLKRPRRGKADDLTAISGIGKAIETKLFDLGIFHVDQIAAWSADEAAWVSQALGFPGRAAREDWVGKAGTLAAAASARKPRKRPAVTGKARARKKGA
ncbi:hypothetical protein CSC94_06555 [Zhengella mangrovi]|uniref:Endonuclease n=1 Tax=Zhengella mangrovi TaxID=1982044 RepID=A0A2G1QS72_9HYPH|nr:helix-hairpin-helix domain-containing protein [Zhengella mangrovi]PHP68304.1 hypothetical protein CSC94_06555 [Zhengella mangrovi]